MGDVSTSTITRDQSHGRVDAAILEAIGLGEVHLVVTLLLLLLSNFVVEGIRRGKRYNTLVSGVVA